MKQLPQPDPRGVLAFVNLPDDLQRAEDSTHHADHQRWLNPQVAKHQAHSEQHGHLITCFTRDTTSAEKTLLQHIGHPLADNPPQTHVSYSHGVRFRWWPTQHTKGQ